MNIQPINPINSKNTINSKTRVNSKPSFGALISKSFLVDLAKRGTPEAQKMLESCIGFNAMYRAAQDVNPDRIAREMYDKFHISCDFGNNPIIASCSAITANIFHKLHLDQPGGVFFKNFARSPYENTYAVCTVHHYDPYLNQRYGGFPHRSVILNSMHNWDDVQLTCIGDYNVNHCSTPHFLSTFIHEFVHSAHMANLMRKHIFPSSKMAQLQNDFKNEDTIKLIKKETSGYGSTKPCEMIAEEMTQWIVDSLHPKSLLPHPMIFQMNKLKQVFVMDKLIKAAWDGDIKTVESLRKNNNSFLASLKRRFS